MLVIHSKPANYDIGNLSLVGVKNLLHSLNFDLSGIIDQYYANCEFECEEDQRLYLINYLKNEVNKDVKQICFIIPKLKQSFWVDTTFNHSNVKRVSSYSEFVECYIVDGKKYEYSLIDYQWCHRDSILPFKKNKELGKYRRIFQFLDIFYIHTLIRKLDNLDPDIISNIVYYYYKIIDLSSNIINITLK